MSVDESIRFLNTFRQLKIRGSFVEMASEIALDNQEQITPRYLLTLLISLLELGIENASLKLESSLISSIINASNAKR